MLASHAEFISFISFIVRARVVKEYANLFTNDSERINCIFSWAWKSQFQSFLSSRKNHLYLFADWSSIARFES